MAKVDHLVYATPDLIAGVEQVERLLALKAIPGGQHPAWGTRNALIGLGDETYLEIIGPDPEQPAPDRPRPFGMDEIEAPRLMTWAAKATDLEKVVQEAKRHGVNLGAIHAGSRRRPDGVLLSWRLTDPAMPREGGLIPFFIDWGETPHPGRILTGGGSLIGLRAEHPAAERVQTILNGLGLNLPVRAGAIPTLWATVSTPRGPVEFS